MAIKHVVIIVAYGVFCFVGSLAFVHCSEKRVQKQLQEAEIEAAQSKVAMNMAVAENERLRESMSAYDAVMKRAITAIEKAYYEGVNRNEQIHSDVPADWLQCELPTELQDVFGAYRDRDADSCDEATGSAVDSVR